MARKRSRLAKSRKKVAQNANPIAPAKSISTAEMFSGALHHHHQGDVKAALRDYARVLRLDPGFADAYANMGVALRSVGRFGAAIACYRRALVLGPETAGVHSNLGNALRDMDRYDEALAALDVAISLRAGFADYHWDRALTLLQMGDLESGFREYEWRWKLKNTPPTRFDQPVWDGSELKGRTIMLCREQGMGDMIKFSRYAAMVKDLGGTVIVEAQPELVRLLSTVPGVDKVVTHDAPVPRFDVQIPVLSLPRIFQTTLETVPDRVPYVTAPELHNLRLSRPAASKLAVGIVWAGSPTQVYDRRRSCPMDRFLALMGLADVTFYSLQKGEAAKQLRLSGAAALVTDLSGRLNDFADTAAVLDQLDLVIAVDTAVAHLAGALGRPVWILLSYAGDWRCPPGRKDSPWYPTMRLFQQDRPGDWDGVMARVLAALRDFPTPS
ncbi:MAG TPA: tetratricopeptide repeat-containing glycosyltransferase family protein [Rhodospirillales bacterium]|nr:tetratricopeptide repeat-containing glycosyltransferase family protein [Rhodospirillales bacterium]